uniref:F-box domain-containing protein n=1 Tax=Davidia involucrata TaxID=16924 RepID=A0A5B6YZ04_DAVIN
MILQLLVSVVIAIFGLDGRNVQCLLENEENSTKINDTEEDYICKLPDDILSSIISFLAVRDTVKTTVLSKRWRHLCASISNLNFDWFSMINDPRGRQYWFHNEDNCTRLRHKYVKGLDQFLQFYMGPKIIGFRVSFCFQRKFAGNVDRWINFAIEKDVERLDLNLVCIDYGHLLVPYNTNYSEMYLLSWKLLSKASKLKILRLHSCILEPDFSCRFYNLSTLDLNCVSLGYDGLHSVLSTSLNLEWLRFRMCILPDKLCICDRLIHLKILIIERCNDLKEIELSAINLTTFELVAREPLKIYFSSISKLEKVVFFSGHGDFMPYIFRGLAKDLPYLKTLSIITRSSSLDYMPASPFAFGNVTHMELFATQDRYSDIIKILNPLLNALPILQKLYVKMPISCSDEKTAEQPPQCLHAHLKEVELGGFSGSWNQIQFAIYLLKNAIALERMVVDAHYKFYQRGGEWSHGVKTEWSEERRRFICNHLLGVKFRSEIAEVIIR